MTHMTLEEKIQNLKYTSFNDSKENNFETGEYAFYLLQISRNEAWPVKFIGRSGDHLQFKKNDVVISIPVANITEIDYYYIFFKWEMTNII